MANGASIQNTNGITQGLRIRYQWRDISNKIFFVTVVLILILGWFQRDDSYLEAESGVGYALGIIGGTLMLLLLMYPLRKRLRTLDRMLSIKFWFRLHMLFGVLGPVAILYHSNFSLGSTNSTVALVCMLVVASSGLIGRYLYVQIHHGLYGARTRISEFQAAAEKRREILIKTLPHGEKILGELEILEKIGLSQALGLIHSLRLRQMTRREVSRIRRVLRKAIRYELKNGNQLSRKAAKVIREGSENYFTTVKRAADLRVNERLFSLWHVLHFPLFIMLLVTGIVHVFVVHIY